MKKIFLGLFITALPFFVLAQQNPTGIEVSSKAPVFAAKDQAGNMIKLAEYNKKGPVVLVFYRGQWCPYCNKQLKAIQDSLSMIVGKGASLIAISPEKAENVAKTIAKTKATYPIIFDDGLQIMNLYKVAFKVDDATVARYKTFGVDFNEANGSNGAVLPVPAVYIVGKNGDIIFRHFDPDYRKRVSVKEILSHL
ncbi:MAG: AhpC/TSA family protein [Sediminibacterium sp.]|nr:AhpC/TSA family protein [Sediminibacterium sp.]